MSEDLDPPARVDTVPPAAGQSVFSLPTRLTASQAGALREALVPLITHRELTLDGGDVDSVGVAGLQVLAALMKSRAPRPTRWSAVNPTLLEAAHLSGLTRLLALPDELRAAPANDPPYDPGTAA